MSLETFLIILIVVILPVITITLFLILSGIEDLKLKRYEKKYPHLFELIKKKDELSLECCKFHNTNITPIRRAIDVLTPDLKYMGEERLKSANTELNMLKEQMDRYYIKYYEYLTEEDLLQEEIEAIIRTDEGLFKTMQKLGWCRGEKYDK